MRRATRSLSRRLVACLALVGASAWPGVAGAAAIVNNNAGATGSARYTQSGTSTIAFGSTVLVVYHDTGSFAAAGNQLTGYSLSTDGGSSFTDLGRLPTGAAGDAGNAHLARHEASGTIYMTALQFNGGGLQILRSSDGGLSFAAPVNAAPGVTGANRNSIAVDNAAGPGNGNVYVVTEEVGVGLRLFRSTDGGASFGGGGLLATGVPAPGRAPSVAVGSDHRVTVAYIDTNGTQRTISARSSTDGGQTFGAPRVVTPLSAPSGGDLGLTGVRQGTTAAAGFRASGAPQLVANPVTGELYLVYADKPAGTDKADIFLRRSSDGGLSWSAAQRMNTDAGSNDQWQPTLAVTPDGEHLGVFWYDRRNDAANNRIEYYGRQCDILAGALDCLADFAVSDGAFLPEFGRDPLLPSTFMGDDDNASATNDFFHVAWGDNRDELAGGGGRRDPNVFFRAISVIDNGTPNPVPEPATAWLVVAALLSAGQRRLRTLRRGAARGVVPLLLCAGAALPAAAVPLPAPIVSGSANFNRELFAQTIDTFGLLDHSVSPFGTLQFFSAGLSAPALRATADVGPVANFATVSGVSSGFLRYSFEIVGADGFVPVFAAALGNVAGTAADGGAFEAVARWSLRDTSERTLVGNSVSVFLNDVLGGGSADDESFAQEHPVMLEANREYRVVMEVIARGSTGVNAVGFGDATAFVDPVFRFGAGVDPALYAFRFSEGIGNTLTPPAAVPEPGTAVLAGLGLLGLGLVARRRGRAPLAAS